MIILSLFLQMTKSQIRTLKKEKETALFTVLQPDIHVCSDVVKVPVTWQAQRTEIYIKFNFATNAWPRVVKNTDFK